MNKKIRRAFLFALIVITVVTGLILFGGKTNQHFENSAMEEETLEQISTESTTSTKSEFQKDNKKETVDETVEIIEKEKKTIKKNEAQSTKQHHPSSSDFEEKKGHYEEHQVCVQKAYDEQVLVKKGKCTQILVHEAYDTEEMVYLDGAYYGTDQELINWCYICEHSYDDHCHQEAHPSTTKLIDVSEPYWHNVEYRTIHHDAVYETQCEPDEYTAIHHDAIYRTETVWVDD